MSAVANMELGIYDLSMSEFPVLWCHCGVRQWSLVDQRLHYPATRLA